MQPVGFDVGCDNVIKAGLKNGDFAAQQPRNALRVLVDARHIMAEVGKTGA
jgi:hypothetical protein